VCVSLWIEKAVEVHYVHDKRACLPQLHAATSYILILKEIYCLPSRTVAKDVLFSRVSAVCSPFRARGGSQHVRVL